MNTFEKWQIGLGCVNSGILLVTFIAAVYVGYKANKINDRVRLLQDYTAVAAIPADSFIKLLNVGKVNLYLWGFDMPGNTHHFDKARLMPAGTNDSAYYYIGTPDLRQIKNDKFDFKLFMTDQFGGKWVTEAGGDVTDTRIEKDGKPVETKVMKVWTYNTHKEDWNFNNR